MKKLVIVFVLGLFFVSNTFAADEVYIKNCEIVHKSIKYYERLVTENPEDVCSYYNLAREYHKKGKPQQYLDNLYIILEINPKDKDVYSLRAHTFWLYKNPEKFYGEYARAIQNIPDYVIGHSHVANAYENILDYDNALKHINIAIELTKESDDHLFFRRGMMYRDMGRYEDAIIDFSKSIELKPENSTYYYFRGNCYEKTGKTSEAEADKEMSKKLNNYKSNIFNKIGLKFFIIKDRLFYTQMLL